MATLALSVAGAGLGSLSGIGAGAGWQVGSALGRLFFPEETAKGTRLTDLKLSGASYGVSIPRLFGTMRLGGNIIWAAPLESRAKTVETGGKGGASTSGTSTGYEYFASFALGLTQGPVGALLKIWADGTLLVDRTAAGEMQRAGVHFRFYKGEEDQQPDSIIETEEGVGNAPAYRGLSYIVFDSLPLADFGNRIPNLEVLLSMEGVSHFPVEEGQTVSVDPSSLAYDRDRGTVFTYEVTGGVDRVRSVDLESLTVTGEVQVGNGFPRLPSSTDGFSLDRTGLFWIGTGYAELPGRKIETIDSRTLAVVASKPLPDGIGALTWSTDIASSLDGRRFQVAGSQQSGQVVLFSDALDVIDHVETSSPACTGVVTDQNEVAWVVMSGLVAGSPFTDLQIVRVGLAAAPGAFETAYEADTTVFTLSSASLTPMGGGGDETNTITRLVGYLTSRQELVFQNDYRLFKWSTITHGVTVQRNDSAISDLSLRHDSSGDELVYIHDGRWLVYLDAETLLEKEREDLRSFPGVDSFTDWVYDAGSDSIFVTGLNVPLRRLYLRRQSGAEADIRQTVSSLSLEAGLAAGDVNVSGLTGVVPGYILNRPMAVQDALEPLMTAGDFDVSESGYQIKYIPRDQGDIVALSEEDLLAPLSLQRLQESELPGSVSLTYMAADGGYQSGSQIAKRSYAPQATMFGRNSSALDLPMALTAPHAKRICRRSLFSAWSERQISGLSLPLKHLALDAADLVTVNRDDHSFTARVNRTDLGADLSQDVQAVMIREESETLPEADTGDGYKNARIERPDQTELFVLSVPLLRDEDATAGNGSRYYYAMDGKGSNWQGAALFSSRTGDRFDHRGVLENRVCWGITLSALAETENPWQTDYRNSVDVRFIRGGNSLENISREELLCGRNALLVGEEIIQFATVEALPDGNYRLSTLLRGRRGTEAAVQDHKPGEKVLFLSKETLGRDILALSDLQTTLFYKAVSAGELLENAPATPQRFEGRDLMPYAPVHLKGTRASDALTLSWVRRTRIGGGSLAGSVPLSEASERYEIEIAYEEEEVSRYVQDRCHFTYTVTDFNTDFSKSLTEMPELHITVYQLSEAVGRGLPSKEIY